MQEKWYEEKGEEKNERKARKIVWRERRREKIYKKKELKNTRRKLMLQIWRRIGKRKERLLKEIGKKKWDFLKTFNLYRSKDEAEV